MNDNSELLHKLVIAQISSCSCQTKTPEAQWHDTHCLYRVLSEAASALTHLETDNSVLRLQLGGMQMEVDEQAAALTRIRAEHSDLVDRNAMLRARPDLPVDRIPAHDKLVELQSIFTAPPFGFWRVPKGFPLQGMFIRWNDEAAEHIESVGDIFDFTLLYAPRH